MNRFIVVSLSIASCFMSGCSPPGTNAVSRDSGIVRGIIASHLGVQIENVKLDSTMKSLGADVLDLVEIVMNIEDQFDISITNERFTETVEAEKNARALEKLTVQHIVQWATE